MFQETDYKIILRGKIEENRSSRGYQKALAEACRCHTSFISQVLSSHVHITPDHAASLCEYWRMSQEETDFFIALVQFARAGSPAYRRYLKQQMDAIRKNRKSVTARISKQNERNELSESAQQFYYSSWQVMAIHVLASVPGHSAPEDIANRLLLPVQYVTSIIATLMEHGFLIRSGKGFELSNKDIHLPAHSPLVFSHHANWRIFAAQKIPISNNTGTHYSGIFAISRKDFDLLQERLLHYIEETKQVVVNSPEEEVYCLNLDLFPL